MSAPSNPVISLQSIPLTTGMDDREGRLVLVDGSLVAVIVRLDDPAHGPLVGRWFVEAGFGPGFGSLRSTFDSPEQAAAWAAAQAAA